MSEELLNEAAAFQDDFLRLLGDLVGHESPSGDVERIGELARFLAGQFEARGATVEPLDAPGAGTHLLVRIQEGGEGKRPLLFLGHMDTVHPVGTLQTLPFEIAGDKVMGPGVYDMKSGIATVLVALDLLARRGERPADAILMLVTCDEEVGSATSRPLIEEWAAGARGCLVMEPSVPGGGAKTRRKGVAQYELTIRGKAAHSGIEPEKGVSAVLELAHQIVRLGELADPESGTTVNVGVVEGGTKTNVVAEHASARIDVRFWSQEEAQRMHEAIRALEPVDPRCRLTVEGEINRYPLEKTEASDALYRTARGEAEKLGFELGEGGSGGASDGNFTSGIGCPTVDGLGLDGGGAHSLEEHILLEDIPRRIALTSRLLTSL